MISKVEGNFEGLGPAVEGIFMTGRGMGGHDFFLVFKDHPEMNKPIGPYRLSLESAPVQFYSVFQVKHDPGRLVGLCRFSPVPARILPGLLPAPRALGRGPATRPPRAAGRDVFWGRAPGPGKTSISAGPNFWRNLRRVRRHESNSGHGDVDLFRGGHHLGHGRVMVFPAAAAGAGGRCSGPAWPCRPGPSSGAGFPPTSWP